MKTFFTHFGCGSKSAKRCKFSSPVSSLLISLFSASASDHLGNDAGEMVFFMFHTPSILTDFNNRTYSFSITSKACYKAHERKSQSTLFLYLSGFLRYQYCTFSFLFYFYSIWTETFDISTS